MARKTAYLTIDDAPSRDFAQKADYLISRGIPAVWFCAGRSLEKNSDIMADAIRKGFVVGNHSYGHPQFSDLTVEQAYDQIRRTDEILDRIYAMSGRKRPGRFFRFPYGDKGGSTHSDFFKACSLEGRKHKEAIQSSLRELGYTQPRFADVTYPYLRKAGMFDDADWFWSYDVHEWSITKTEPTHGVGSLEKIFERMDETAPEEGRGLNTSGSAEIVLMHDHAATTEYFAPIVDRLLAKGLDFRLPEF
ncbi:MAG: polysaccharide deacetylase family protein [Planctomycetes bacterium]|nr:polysaccharide deacetylase family protein [Planctomycetota bacterium]